jgi:asparagine synthase (glutamine-hydrolysing)
MSLFVTALVPLRTSQNFLRRLRLLKTGDISVSNTNTNPAVCLLSSGLPCEQSGSVTIALSGQVAVAPESRRNDNRAIERIYREYRRRGQLDTAGLEGSFTVLVVDAERAAIQIHRNLFGTSATYYWSSGRTFIASSNLAVLVSLLENDVRADESVLPAYFIFRATPGRHTLFHGISRLLPGELLTADARGVRVVQKQTIADLYGPAADTAAEPEFLEATIAEIVRASGASANLFSGGVDSTYLQAVALNDPAGAPITPYTIDVDHAYTRAHTDSAVSAGRALGIAAHLYHVERPYIELLAETIAQTGEPPNHVQTAYFGALARYLADRGVTTALCGQAADSLFGIQLAARFVSARALRALVPSRHLLGFLGKLAALVNRENLIDVCRIAADLGDPVSRFHPFNRVAVFTDWNAIDACFGRRAADEALQARTALVDVHGIRHPTSRLHFLALLGEALDTASLWTALFDRAGVELVCPFLDSRVARAVVNLAPRSLYRFRRPKEILKRTLRRLAPAYDVAQPKLGFGQPIFEWLGPGGQLRDAVEQIDCYDFMAPGLLQRLQANPTWFLYSLLCYDVWHKTFIKRPSGAPGGEPLIMVEG